MTAALLLVLTLPVLASPGDPAPTVFQAIEARYQAGAIDAETRLRHRVEALRRPALLPPALRELPLRRDDRGPTSGTRVVLEAYQHVARTGQWGGALHALLQPPADLTYVLDSTQWPIRVSYGRPLEETLARRALAAAETAWSVEIGDYGFYQPPTLDGSGLYRIFIDDTGMGGGGYTAPYEMNPDTPWDDCFTYIVIDPSNSQWEIDGVMAHEANHAMQAAMDCLEVSTFWENTATFVMSQVFPDAWYYTVGTMGYFQSQPWRALDFMATPYSDLYEYGGGLFAYYLAETLAPLGDPAEPKAASLRRIWEASMQNTGFNEPDYYDGIEGTLSTLGAVTAIEEVVVDFSETRYFVADQDDGEHLPRAWELGGAELALTAEYSSAALPVRGATPPSSVRPAPFGSNHVLLSLTTGYAHPLRVRFDGADNTRWAVRLVRFGRGQTVSEDLPLAAETWDGSAVVDPGGFSKLLLVVVNLGAEDYDPDHHSWPPGDYTYDIQPVLPPPVLEAVVPGEVARGQQNLSVRLQGSGFSAGAEFFVRFEDPDLQVVSVGAVDPTEVLLTITVPMGATLGPKTIVLVNGDGTVARGEGLLLVVDPEARPGPGDDPKGCGCAADPDAGAGGLLLLFGLLLFRRRRRRR